MDHDPLLRRIAELETINDQLQAEFHALDNLLRDAGFEQGIATLKAAALELIEEDRRDTGN
jgi:hypothetical protein